MRFSVINDFVFFRNFEKNVEWIVKKVEKEIVVSEFLLTTIN